MTHPSPGASGHKSVIVAKTSRERSALTTAKPRMAKVCISLVNIKYKASPVSPQTPMLGLKSHSIPGTDRRFSAQTNMNEYLKTNPARRAGLKCPQSVPRAGATSAGLQLQHALRPQPSLTPTALLDPARELLICLGWVRLYQTILSPSRALYARKEFREQ